MRYEKQSIRWKDMTEILLVIVRPSWSLDQQICSRLLPQRRIKSELIDDISFSMEKIWASSTPMAVFSGK